MTASTTRLGRTAVGIALTLAGGLLAPGSRAQMVSGLGIPGTAEVLRLDPREQTRPYAVQYVGSSAPANVLWPGAQAWFDFQPLGRRATGLGRA
jgi:hypothetical protein